MKGKQVGERTKIGMDKEVDKKPGRCIVPEEERVLRRQLFIVYFSLLASFGKT